MRALLVAGLALADTARAQTNQRPGDQVLIDLMHQYCLAPDRNPYWCTSDGRARDIPDVQRYDVLNSYCEVLRKEDLRPARPGDPKDVRLPSAAAPTLCDGLKQVQEPLSLVYRFRTGTWNLTRLKELGADKGRARVEVDAVTARPTLFVRKGERLSTIVEEVNPVTYGAERGEPTLRDIEGIDAIKASLAAAGSMLGTLVRLIPASGGESITTQSKDRGRSPASIVNAATLFSPSLTRIAKDARTLRNAVVPAERALDRLERQHRRLARLSRAMDAGPTTLGRPFEREIETPDEWTRLFENLRQAPDALTFKGCDDLTSAYLDLLAHADTAATLAAKLEAFEARFTSLASVEPCPALPIVPTLSASAAMIRAGVSSSTANAVLEEEAGKHRREVTEIRTALATFKAGAEGAAAFLAKEDAVRKQAALSERLSTRAMRAAIQAFGGTPVPTEQPCVGTAQAKQESSRAWAERPTSWSLRVHPREGVTPLEPSTNEDQPTYVTEPFTVRVSLTRGERSAPPLDVKVPAGVAFGEDVPIGVWDLDLFSACNSLGSSNYRLAVVKHQGYVLTDRLYVKDYEFKGRMTKVQQESVTIARLEPSSADASGLDVPKQRELRYDVARRSGALFGASVGMIYTPVVSRTFSLVDPSPESSTTVKTTVTANGMTTETVFPESRVITETDSDARSGFLAAFLNVRLLQWLKPDTATAAVKPGLEVGFAMSSENPALLVGASFEFGRYVRAGVGGSWVSATDLSDRSLLGATVPSAYSIQTDKRMRPSWYASLTLALDGLPIFSGGK